MKNTNEPPPVKTEKVFNPPNCRLVERDGISPETALDQLCNAPSPMTNRFRKACLSARVRTFESTRERKPVEQKLYARFREATLAQLIKWQRRAVTARFSVQSSFLKVSDWQDGKRKAAMLQTLETLAGVLDLKLELLEKCRAERA
jgi:hypothetical protein